MLFEAGAGLEGIKVIAKQVQSGLDWLWFLTGEDVANFGWCIG